MIRTWALSFILLQGEEKINAAQQAKIRPRPWKHFWLSHKYIGVTQNKQQTKTINLQLTGKKLENMFQTHIAFL